MVSLIDGGVELTGKLRGLRRYIRSSLTNTQDIAFVVAGSFLAGDAQGPFLAGDAQGPDVC